MTKESVYENLKEAIREIVREVLLEELEAILGDSKPQEPEVSNTDSD